MGKIRSWNQEQDFLSEERRQREMVEKQAKVQAALEAEEAKQKKRGKITPGRKMSNFLVTENSSEGLSVISNVQGKKQLNFKQTKFNSFNQGTTNIS